MEDITAFLKALLSHWPWLTAAVVALVLYSKNEFRENAAVVLMVVAIGSLMIALYLAAHDQYRVLNQYLQSS